MATNPRRKTKVDPQTLSSLVKIKAVETIHSKFKDLMLFYVFFFLATFLQMQFCCCIQYFFKHTKGVKINAR